MRIDENWVELVSRLEADLRARAAGVELGRDEAAWQLAADLLRAYGRVLLRTHPGLRQEELDDAVQDILVKLQSLSTLRRLKAAGSPAGYVAVMLRNAGTDLLRKRQRSAEVGLSEHLTSLDTSEDVVPQEQSERLGLALRSLSPEEQNLLRLRFWRGLSIAEIADISDATYSATAVRLFRILHKLRQRLGLPAP
jgi:RNA polymerase sigma factor (sigma-70 family)